MPILARRCAVKLLPRQRPTAGRHGRRHRHGRRTAQRRLRRQSTNTITGETERRADSDIHGTRVAGIIVCPSLSSGSARRRPARVSRLGRLRRCRTRDREAMTKRSRTAAICSTQPGRGDRTSSPAGRSGARGRGVCAPDRRWERKWRGRPPRTRVPPRRQEDVAARATRPGDPPFRQEQHLPGVLLKWTRSIRRAVWHYLDRARRSLCSLTAPRWPRRPCGATPAAWHATRASSDVSGPAARTPFRWRWVLPGPGPTG